MELYLHNGIAVGCSASPWTYFNWPIKTEQELHVQFAFRYKTCALGPHCVFLCTVWFSASSREQHEFNWSSWRTAFFVTRLHAIPINFSHPVLTVKAKVRFRNSPREMWWTDCKGDRIIPSNIQRFPCQYHSIIVLFSVFFCHYHSTNNLYSLFSCQYHPTNHIHSASPVSNIPPISYFPFSPVSIILTTLYTLFSPVSIILTTLYTLLPLSVTFHQYPIFPFPLSVSF